MPQVKSIVILDGHPDPNPNHLCHGLASRYFEAALENGHKAHFCRIADLTFPILRDPSDFTSKPPPEALLPVRDFILAADHLVLVYPLWLGTLPAYTKAFLEQVFNHDTAFEQQEGAAFPKGKMSGKSARIVVTMGMPAIAYKLWFCAHSLKSLERNVFKFIGFKPVRSTVYGMVETANKTTINKWMSQMDGFAKDAV